LAGFEVALQEFGDVAGDEVGPEVVHGPRVGGEGLQGSEVRHICVGKPPRPTCNPIRSCRNLRFLRYRALRGRFTG
jgi:hypothetical protein